LNSFIIEIAEIDLPAPFKVLVNENHGAARTDIRNPIPLPVVCGESVNAFEI
jgi:hypothetical protein